MTNDDAFVPITVVYPNGNTMQVTVQQTELQRVLTEVPETVGTVSRGVSHWIIGITSDDLKQRLAINLDNVTHIFYGNTAAS